METVKNNQRCGLNAYMTSGLKQLEQACKPATVTPLDIYFSSYVIGNAIVMVIPDMCASTATRISRCPTEHWNVCDDRTSALMPSVELQCKQTEAPKANHSNPVPIPEQFRNTQTGDTHQLGKHINRGNTTNADIFTDAFEISGIHSCKRRVC